MKKQSWKIGKFSFLWKYKLIMNNPMYTQEFYYYGIEYLSNKHRFFGFVITGNKRVIYGL